MYTIGVEEEYQLVDPATAQLRSSAHSVLEGDWTGDIQKELQASTIEIGTRVCESAAGVAEELRRLRTQAAAAAGSLDLKIVAAGLHPFSDWREHHLARDERYTRIAERYGRIARDEHTFGMHVHVAVEGDRLAVLNTVRRYIPHLLALSCSSPIFEGEDTGFASYRSLFWRRWPASGVPPRLSSEAEYRRYVDDLLRAGVIGDEGNLYWSIRPHGTYPTLEFRMYDVCPRMGHAVAIAGLTRALVAAACERMLPREPRPWSVAVADSALADDAWRAARFGLDARLLDPSLEEGYETAREAVRRLLDAVAPAAAELGDETALEAVEVILDRGTGADRLRSVFEETGDPVAATQWLAAETVLGAGMDRRSELRAEDVREHEAGNGSL